VTKPPTSADATPHQPAGHDQQKINQSRST